MKKIMAVNAGSSSLKFQLLNMPHISGREELLIEGLFERIGIDNPQLTIKYMVQGEYHEEKTALQIKDHGQAVEILIQTLLEKGLVTSLEELGGIGHRVVHGGEKFKDSVVITPQVIDEIEKVSDLAPLHNPANLIGIRAFRNLIPSVKQVAVFDTSFHQTMPEEAYLYAIPYEWYKKYGIRKYGFHGTSHKYVALQASKYLGKPLEKLRLITAHIGNGGSIAAIKYGKCIDTSMGFTPLAGIPMGTRSGTIDPAILDFIAEKEGLTLTQITNILNKQSGYLGFFKSSSDARDLRVAEKAGDHLAGLVLQMQNKAICDFISAYYGYLGGLDALVFTAGIGEKSPESRADICKRLKEPFGIEIDENLNRIKGEFLELSLPTSKVSVLVIPTNEELMIALDVMRLTKI